MPGAFWFWDNNQMGVCTTLYLLPRPIGFAAADRDSHFVQTIQRTPGVRVFFGSSFLNRTCVSAEKPPPN